MKVLENFSVITTKNLLQSFKTGFPFRTYDLYEKKRDVMRKEKEKEKERKGTVDIFLPTTTKYKPGLGAFPYKWICINSGYSIVIP